MLCGEWYLYGWRWIPVHPHGEIAFYLIRDTGGLQFTILRIFFQFQMLHDEHLHSPVPCHGGGLFYFIMDTDAHRWQTILQRLFTFFFFKSPHDFCMHNNNHGWRWSPVTLSSWRQSFPVIVDAGAPQLTILSELFIISFHS